MANRSIEMSDLVFISINVPLVSFSLIANIFFAWCIFSPPVNYRIKQPLKTLLGFLICCTIAYFISNIAAYCVFRLGARNNIALRVLSVLVLYTVYISMTSYVWLSFYYNIQIVPVRLTVSIWVKKNIKSTIYLILLLDRMIFLCYYIYYGVRTTAAQRNTTAVNATHSGDQVTETFTIIIKGYVFMCLCVMMASSFSTVHYIFQHTRYTSAISSNMSSSLRVAVIGITQGLLYLMYEIWFFYNYYPTYWKFGPRIIHTVNSLYITATAVTLSVGQTLFRERIVHMWIMLKALCVNCKVTNITQTAPDMDMTSTAHAS